MNKFVFSSWYVFIISLCSLLFACNSYPPDSVEDSVILSKTAPVIFIGDTLQLTPTVTGDIQTEVPVWNSKTPAVASVSDGGLITACSAGTSTISLTIGGVTAVCTVTVKNDTTHTGSAWAAAAAMGFGVNIGNTLENTTAWETGWGEPKITQAFIKSLRSDGFKSVRVPVAWNTYADDGTITETEFNRVSEVIDWITDEGMYCIINIHWDGGWIDNDNNNFEEEEAYTLTDEAEVMFSSYWTQIASRYKNKSGLLIFESLNEESNFSNDADPYASLNYLNRTFVDIVRSSGGNNAERLLLIAGYCTDITNSCAKSGGKYRLVIPEDTVENKLLVSVHYYTPWTFCGLETDADWGSVQETWGSSSDVESLVSLFNTMDEFCTDTGCPAVIGEFGVIKNRADAYRFLWMRAVAEASFDRQMVPMLWDTGYDVQRSGAYGISTTLSSVLASF